MWQLRTSASRVRNNAIAKNRTAPYWLTGGQCWASWSLEQGSKCWMWTYMGVCHLPVLGTDTVEQKSGKRDHTTARSWAQLLKFSSRLWANVSFWSSGKRLYVSSCSYSASKICHNIESIMLWMLGLTTSAGGGYKDVFLFIAFYKLLSRDSWKCLPDGYANTVLERKHVFLS